MSHENTRKTLREILGEMFSDERVAAVNDEAPACLETLGAKSTDRVDFVLFVEEKLSVRLPLERMDNFSIEQIACFIDIMTPSANPH